MEWVVYNDLNDDTWSVNGVSIKCGVVHAIEGVCFIRVIDGQFVVENWSGYEEHRSEPYPTLEAAKLAAELIYG